MFDPVDESKLHPPPARPACISRVRLVMPRCTLACLARAEYSLRAGAARARASSFDAHAGPCYLCITTTHAGGTSCA